MEKLKTILRNTGYHEIHSLTHQSITYYCTAYVALPATAEPLLKKCIDI